MGLWDGIVKRGTSPIVRKEDVYIDYSKLSWLKKWFDDGFVVITPRFIVYKSWDELTSTNTPDFYVYNHTKKEKGYWYALELHLVDNKWEWSRYKSPQLDKIDKCKALRKWLREIIMNYDAIIAGTYVKAENKPRKRRIRPSIPLQKFLIDQGWDEDNWNKTIHQRSHSDWESFTKNMTDEEKQAFEDYDYIDEVVCIYKISKGTMMKAVKYKYMSLFASYWSDMYAGVTLWYEDERGNVLDVATPKYDEDGNVVLSYTDLSKETGRDYKASYGRFDSEEEYLFEQSWDDLADFDVEIEGLELKDGKLTIYYNGCEDGDALLEEAMSWFDN